MASEIAVYLSWLLQIFAYIIDKKKLCILLTNVNTCKEANSVDQDQTASKVKTCTATLPSNNIMFVVR